MNFYKKLNRVFLIIVVCLSVTFCSKTSKEKTGLTANYDTVLFAPGDHEVREYRIPSLVTTNSGTLLAACDARVSRTGDLPNHINISLRRSTDNGKTWGAITNIITSSMAEGSCDPSMVVDKETGTIWLFALHGDKGIGLWQSKKGIEEKDTGHIYAVKSNDDGITWSAPVNINHMVKDKDWLCALAAPGRGFQMKNGTLVIPAYYRGDKSRVLSSYLFYSKDHGATWQYSSSPAINTTECTVVEVSDGKLMLNMRNHYGKGRRAVSYTSDMGKTWSPLEFVEDLKDPVCQASMITYKHKKQNLLLFSNASSEKGRKNQAVAISYDQGKTWPVQKTIFKGRAAYSCLTQLNDGTIGLLYEKENRGAISFRRITYDWLTTDVKQKTIVVFGNSTTAFRPMAIKKVFSERLEEKLHVAGIPSVVINSGVGGSHTGSIKDNDRHKKRHALDRFQSDVLDYKPDVVIMQYGINDSYVDTGGSEGKSRISLVNYRKNLNFMVQKMQNEGVDVMLMTPNQFDERKDKWRNDRLFLYVEQMRKVAKEYNTKLIDVWELNNDYLKKNPSLKPLLIDGVHPNDLAHEIIANEIEVFFSESLCKE